MEQSNGWKRHDASHKTRRLQTGTEPIVYSKSYQLHEDVWIIYTATCDKLLNREFSFTEKMRVYFWGVWKHFYIRTIAILLRKDKSIWTIVKKRSPRKVC